ncbi:MAG TPA: hypothetical protein VMV27_07560 [Candidatus Binataceae bacterium]|nr:hypothetical protein [Candidatus Binataceae bacterium]
MKNFSGPPRKFTGKLLEKFGRIGSSIGFLHALYRAPRDAQQAPVPRPREVRRDASHQTKEIERKVWWHLHALDFTQSARAYKAEQFSPEQTWQKT